MVLWRILLAGAGGATAIWLAFRLLVARGHMLLARPDADQQALESTVGEVQVSRVTMSRQDALAAQLLNSNEANALAHAGASFDRDANGQVICRVGGVTAPVRNGDELRIMHEIFADQGYNIVLDEPCLVWDVGMNVALASLYFAARGAFVVGYEPVKRTFEAALENLSLNPDLADRITAINLGVGGWNRTEFVDFCEELKGSVGLRGAAGDRWLSEEVLHLTPGVPRTKVAIEMQDAPAALAAVLATHPNLPVIAKIDCEGAEYEIVEALHRSGDLARIRAFLIEWHLDGPEPLERHLRDAGFTVFSPSHRRGLWGRVYAAR